MAAGRIVLSQYFPARDRNGRLVAGARLTVYLNRTTTKAAVYADEALTVPLANPAIANSSGQFAAMWADDAVTYTLSVTAADGSSIGNPSVFDDYSVSTDYDAATAAIAEAASAAAAAYYEDILAIEGAGGDAAAIATRAAKTSDLTDLANPERARNTLGHFATRAVAVAASINPLIQSLTTDGYASTSDGGGSVYRRASSEPAHPGKFQSADGAWWEKVREATISPEQFGARGDAALSTSDGFTPTVTGTDDQQAFDDADAYLAAIGGGTLVLMAKTYRLGNGARLWRGNSLSGTQGQSILAKSGAGTRAITPYGVADGGLSDEVYPTDTLPTDISAVLVLDGPDGRWIGQVSGVTLVGALSGTDLDTGLLTDFGIVSTGSVSDSQISNTTVFACKHAYLIPDQFTTRWSENRANICHAGFGFNKFTSLTAHGNYASSCRGYGHVYRDGIYGKIFANACDATNDPARYSDRSRLATAYKLLGCDGVTFENNGQEQTWGTNYKVDGNRDSVIDGNVVIGLGSDTTGQDVAIWDLGSGAGNIRVTIENNPVITYKAEGLLSGGATAARHFNILSNERTDQRLITWRNNTIREVRGSGAALSRGYAGAWSGGGTFGGTVFPPLEKVEYDILYDGIDHTAQTPAGPNGFLIMGAEQGVTAAKNGTGDYTFTFDTPFVTKTLTYGGTDAPGAPQTVPVFTASLNPLTRRLDGPTDTYGMGAYEHKSGRTATSMRVICQFTNAVFYDHERLAVQVSGYVDRMA